MLVPMLVDTSADGPVYSFKGFLSPVWCLDGLRARVIVKLECTHCSSGNSCRNKHHKNAMSRRPKLIITNQKTEESHKLLATLIIKTLIRASAFETTSDPAMPVLSVIQSAVKATARSCNRLLRYKEGPESCSSSFSWQPKHSRWVMNEDCMQKSHTHHHAHDKHNDQTAQFQYTNVLKQRPVIRLNCYFTRV